MTALRWDPPRPDEPIDAVITWVDGDWPGYRALQAEHHQRPVDLNPNRTRDNLDILRYTLRSLARFAPWLRRVHVVSARPQVPAWLDVAHPRVRLVHHDEFIPARYLPTFSSFAIIAHLYRIPDLARVALYVEDDRPLGRPLRPRDLIDASGRPRLHRRVQWTPDAARAGAPDLGPWDEALAQANACLDARFGRRRRRTVKYAPVLLERSSYAALWDLYPEAMERTAASKFRAPGCVAPEHLYPYTLWEQGDARWTPWEEAYRETAYVGLANVPGAMDALLWFQRLRRPAFTSLNDNFGERPSPWVVAAARRYLRGRYPWPAAWERCHD